MKTKRIKTGILSVGMLLGTLTLAACQKTETNSSTPSSSEVTPSKDSEESIPSSKTEEIVNVESLSLTLPSNELKVGEEKQLMVNVLPSSATNKAVTYVIEGDAVSVSSSGVIKGEKEGRARIKAKSVDGNKEAHLEVFVSKYQNEYTFEGEDASVSACVASTDTNASNGKTVGQISGGSTITFTLNSEEEQTTDLKVVTSVVGADRLNFARYFTINVNGTNIENPTNDLIDVGENYGYSNYGKFIFNNVSLVKGKNIIILTGVNDVMTNLDKIALKANKEVKFYSLEIPDGTGESYIFEHTDAELAPGSMGYMSITEEAGARNGDALGNCFNNNGATISYKITSSEAKEATMYVNMALGSAVTDNPFKVSLNGDEMEIPTTYKDPSASWHHFQEFKVARLSLLEGENDVVITITGGCGNFDYAKFVSEATLSIEKEVPVVEGKEYRFEAEFANLESCSIGTDNNGASGNNHVGGINANSKITYNITSKSAQTVSLKIRMIIVGEDRLKLASSFALTVNDENVTSDEDFTTLGLFNTWNNWGEMTIKGISLNEGNNVIKLSGVNNVMTNLDCISIYANDDVYFTNDAAKTSYKFEAEDAILTNCAPVSEDNGASGGKHVGTIGTGSEIKYQISSEKSQFINMKMVSAIVGADRLPMKINYKEIDVNGFPLFYNDEAKWSTPSSFGWGAWAEFTLKSIHLNAGLNDITIKFADGAMTNFDYIELAAPSKVSLYKEITGEKYIFEAENATQEAGSSGYMSINDDANASGSKALGNVCNNYNAKLTFKVNATEKVSVRLFAVIANGGTSVDNPFTLSLNGNEVGVPTHYEDAEANWAHYKEFELADIDLIAGENSITFTITGGCGNFDCIKLLSPLALN